MNRTVLSIAANIAVILFELIELADRAGAIYRMDGTVLINRDICDAYL